MNITNKNNLPQPIYDAVKNDSYDKGESDFTVTGLLKPPRQAALQAKHWAELEEDCSDRIWALMGQLMHGLLERSATSGIVEKRFYTIIDNTKIGGQIDRYENGTIGDYKFVSAYKLKRGVPEEYTIQLNMLAELMRQNGHVVNKLELVGILRDWSKMEATRDPAYPQSQVMVLPVELWPPGMIQDEMRARVREHKSAQACDVLRQELPECTEADRWAKPTVYAVMKEGKERALKLYGSCMEASAHADLDKSLSVIKRPGSNTRCENFCSVSKFCTQYQEMKGNKNV